MPSDVTLFEKGLSGALDPKAAWTADAKRNVDDALDSLLTERGANVMLYQAQDGSAEVDSEHSQLYKRHQAVGGAILIHKYVGLELPTKENTFDWSLGPDAQRIAQDYNCDYGLFVYYRDTFASAGRVATMIVASLFTYGVGGAAIGGGETVAFASPDRSEDRRCRLVQCADVERR